MMRTFNAKVTITDNDIRVRAEHPNSSGPVLTFGIPHDKMVKGDTEGFRMEDFTEWCVQVAKKMADYDATTGVREATALNERWQK